MRARKRRGSENRFARWRAPADRVYNRAVTDKRQGLRLPLVLPGEELSGLRPLAFERAVKSCKVGDPVHRAVIFAAEAVASRGVQECLAPSARSPFSNFCRVARSFTEQHATLLDVKQARAAAFDLAGDAERKTLTAIAKAIAIEGSDPLDRQAAISVRRYVARSVHHAIAGVLMTLDAVTRPVEALPIAEEVAGAIAFQRTGLGAARSPALREAARVRADWETKRLDSDEQPTVAIALQLFHEYLGAHWKDHADAQRAYFEDFLAWVFENTAPGTVA